MIIHPLLRWLKILTIAQPIQKTHESTPNTPTYIHNAEFNISRLKPIHHLTPQLSQLQLLLNYHNRTQFNFSQFPSLQLILRQKHTKNRRFCQENRKTPKKYQSSAFGASRPLARSWAPFSPKKRTKAARSLKPCQLRLLIVKGISDVVNSTFNLSSYGVDCQRECGRENRDITSHCSICCLYTSVRILYCNIPVVISQL